MAEAKLRIKQKHDTEVNWLKATTFVPLDGELIIYDVDDTHSTPRFKMGDGIQVVGDLPFLADGINSQYLRNNYIPIKEITSGSFIVPQIGYNKELNWIDCNVSISAQSIVQRDGNGIIYINPPDTVPENINEYAGVNVQYANKTYVKAINVTENTYVYAASNEGPNGKLRVSADIADGSTIVQRSSTGTIITADPVKDQEAVTKKYVEDNFVKPNTNVKFSDVIIGAYPDGEYAQYSTSRINIGDHGQVFQFAFPIYNVPTDQVNDILTSGNVKTINGNSIVGSGDITISGGGDVTLAGNNIFTGVNTFQQSTETNSGEIIITPNVTAPCVTVSAATIIGGIPETNKTEINSTDVTITNSTKFWTKYGIKQIVYGMGSEYNTLDVPDKSGTIALTSDIKIKSASLDGTTLTLTI